MDKFGYTGWAAFIAYRNHITRWEIFNTNKWNYYMIITAFNYLNVSYMIFRCIEPFAAGYYSDFTAF